MTRQSTFFIQTIHHHQFGGLAISMSVGLLMIAFITDIYSFDTFHDKYFRIYG